MKLAVYITHGLTPAVTSKAVMVAPRIAANMRARQVKMAPRSAEQALNTGPEAFLYLSMR